MFFMEEMNIIWINVASGVGQHGSFLTSFASTWCRADAENRQILKVASVALIQKYELATPKYLKEDKI